jgi:seryl-tRNA synthetase
MNQKIEFLQAQHQKELQSLEKEKKREIEALTKQLKIQENQLEKEKKREIEALIKQLKTQENQVKELQNQIFELAKQPKNNITQNTNNHNQRTLNIINQLAPYDLTEKSVRATVEKHYDKEMMLKGPEGLVQFVVEYVLTQPETKKNF